MNRILSKIVYLARRTRAFVARDFHLALSYRMQFFFRLLQVFITLAVLFLISQIFGGGGVTAYRQWSNPLAAWITGLIVLSYFSTGFSSLANAIRTEQAQGTLESVLMTPISVQTLVLASSAWDFVQVSITSALYVFFGWFFFGVEFRGSFLLAALFLLLTTLTLVSVGIFSASFAMVYKRGDPFGVFFATSSALFSGVFFPTQLLGDGFGQISRALPPTYGLDGIRRVLIEGQTLWQVRSPLITLCLFLAVLLPSSLWVFARAVRRAKREGSLIQY